VEMGPRRVAAVTVAALAILYRTGSTDAQVRLCGPNSQNGNSSTLGEVCGSCVNRQQGTDPPIYACEDLGLTIITRISPTSGQPMFTGASATM
jgi:hypothetical protein